MRAFHLAWLLLGAVALPAVAQPADGSRGQLLYAAHCIECHSVQMHWRAERRARDWGTLQQQVRRWQGEARLQWTEQDIDAVARHLNDTVYRFPRPETMGQAGGR